MIKKCLKLTFLLYNLVNKNNNDDKVVEDDLIYNILVKNAWFRNVKLTFMLYNLANKDNNDEDKVEEEDDLKQHSSQKCLI